MSTANQEGAGESQQEYEMPVYYPTAVVQEGKGMEAVEWYEKALKCKPVAVYKNAKDQTVMHAFLRSAYGIPMAVEESTPKEHNVDGVAVAPNRASATYTYVNVPEGYTCDEAVEGMRAAGARVTHEPRDLFYGHRVGRVIDKYGMAWAFSSKCEVTPDMKMPEKWGH